MMVVSKEEDSNKELFLGQVQKVEAKNLTKQVVLGMSNTTHTSITNSVLQELNCSGNHTNLMILPAGYFKGKLQIR
jgi:hypothetical protein